VALLLLVVVRVLVFLLGLCLRFRRYLRLRFLVRLGFGLGDFVDGGIDELVQAP